MRRLVAATLVSVTLIPGWPAAQTAPGPPLSSSWRRIQTSDFLVIGDARAAELREVARALNAFRAALSRLFPNARLNGASPTMVVVLEDFDAFRRYQPRDSQGRRIGAGAYFSSEADANIMVMPFTSAGSYNTIFHEYTHYFFRLNVRATIPTWLNEGLAEFYATFRPDFQGQSALGAPPEQRVRTLKSSAYLPLRELVSPRDFEKMWRSSRIDMFYAEAWALVHYLTVGRKGVAPASLNIYLRTLAETNSQDDAFKAAYGVDVAGMDRELREYLKSFAFQGLVIPKAPNASIELTVTPAREVDARSVQGRLLHSLDEREAETELQRALMIEPNHVATQVTLARLRLRQERDADAVSMLQKVAEAAPDDFAAHLYLGTALAREWRHEESLAAYSRAATLNERNPYAWLGVSQSAIALGRDAQAAVTLQRALQLETNPGFYYSSGRTAFEAGRYDAAGKALRTYLDAVGLADESKQYAAFLAAYAERRAARPEAATALLAECEAAVRVKTWTETVLHFIQGTLSEQAFLAAAGDVGERTEAHTYIGLAADLAGRRDEAVRHFQWVVDNGAHNYSEYGIAKAELRRSALPRGQ